MIPSATEILDFLIVEIYKSENQQVTNLQLLFNVLQEYFEEELEEDDFIPNDNNWRGRIYQARNILIQDGILFNSKQSGHGIWKLTNYGLKIGKEKLTDFGIEDRWGEVNVEEIFIEEENKFFEGDKKKILIRKSDRNKKVVAQKKAHAYKENQNLPCEICGFSFTEKYGEIGNRFIEAHHLKPLSEITEKTEIREDDLILVCSNCHKMIHRKKQPYSKEEIIEIINNVEKNHSGIT